MKIFVAGSESRIKKISMITWRLRRNCPEDEVRNPFYVYNENQRKGYYKRVKYDSLLEAKKVAIQNLIWADRVIFVKKKDGTFGESVSFELAWCMETGKEFIIQDEEVK